MMEATKNRNTQYCFNTQRGFGTTHFIVDSDNQLLHVLANNKKNIALPVSMRPSIINGSSAHLLNPTDLNQFFISTKHNLSSIILSVLAQAKKNISIAAFSLTDMRIAKLLINAHKNGVQVCLILDPGNMKHVYSKAQKLIDNGVPVWKYEPSLRQGNKKGNGYDPLMHLKWMIVDDVLISGSANLTNAALNGYNVETITVSRCAQYVETHRQELNDLKQYCVRCKPESLVQKNQVQH